MKHVYSVKIFCGKLYLTVLCVTVNVLDPGEGFFEPKVLLPFTPDLILRLMNPVHTQIAGKLMKFLS